MTNDEKRGQFPIMGDPRDFYKDYVQNVLHCDKCPFKGKEDACAELRKSYDICEKYRPPGQPPRGPAAAA